MKAQALNRILEKSPSESLAALSVSALLRCDNTEIERIYGALPSHGKASRHEFFIRHHAMTESILLWAIEYWRTAATAQTCLVAAIAPGTTQIDADVSTFMLNAHKAKLATLIEAMRCICFDTGIDFEDVAAFAEVDTEIDAKPIRKLIPEYVQIFGIMGK
ncbi:MAG: hypothetical protein IPL05_16060 [Betaproteobacteria bacterium]|jgi:hypothetical protein|nr:hypothetical protein [Betaproteobacteria bacterium]